MKIFVTGAAGFIGAAVVKALLGSGHEVVGIDNFDTYYDPSLKIARLAEAGIYESGTDGKTMTVSTKNAAYRFVRMDITDRESINSLFADERFDTVINLAGQAGVRYSIESPYSYIKSNIFGFLNILEACRHYPVRHLLFASLSSVYGMSEKTPYSETDMTDKPVSLYAATKKSDELMAYAYSNLYGIPTTGLRFFTVYGPWGRPDMAPYKFMKAILEGKTIKVFNHGQMQRDFTYIDDIINGLMLLVEHPSEEKVPNRVYNIGESEPINLLDFIRTIEKVTGKKAIMEMEGMQPGDVYCTYADTSRLQNDFGYKPSVSVEEGLTRFYEWYKEYVQKQ